MSQEEKETSEQMNEAVECNESEKNNEIDELSKLQNEVQEYKDKYLRAYADFENTKKRLEKDKISAVAYANSSFAKDLLSVMDSFDGAIASIDIINIDENSEVLKKIKEGILKTHEQLKKVLEKHGISEIECEGCFNPDVHQAIMQVEHEEKQSGEIVQILQKGYSMKDQVLRPAMVSTVK